MPATLRWLMDGSATEPLSAPVARVTGGTAESDCLAGDDSFEESLAVAMRGGLPDRETEARAAAEVRVSCAAHDATESIKLSQPSRYQDIRLTGNQGGSATEPLSAPVARVTGGTAESDCLAGDDSFEESLAVAMRGGLPDPETEARAAAELRVSRAAHEAAKSVKLFQPCRYQDIRLTGNQGEHQRGYRISEASEAWREQKDGSHERSRNSVSTWSVWNEQHCDQGEGDCDGSWSGWRASSSNWQRHHGPDDSSIDVAKFEGSLCIDRGEMVVQLQGRNLTDESATRWCIYARQKVPELIAQHELQRSSDGRGFAYEVNVSNNKLGDCGLYHILKLLYDLNFHIRILKVFQNWLGDGAAYTLADWLLCRGAHLQEIHASHNLISDAGAKA